MMEEGTQFQSPSPTTTTPTTAAFHATTSHQGSSGMSAANSDTSPSKRKRKADSQDNERLSKRLSLLNIEQNGSKLYVPVEGPSRDSLRQDQIVRSPSQAHTQSQPENDMMRLDDSKHKVYIYNIDDELSSSDAESDDGKLVFLPDIEKHLRQNRIPRHILANEDGELAGMQMVLYQDPKSLSFPEDKDGVRKAIIESRRRLRERQARERDESPHAVRKLVDSKIKDTDEDDDAMDMD